MLDTKVKTVNIQRKQTTLVGQLYYHADGRQHPTIIFCPGLGEDVSFVAGYDNNWRQVATPFIRLISAAVVLLAGVRDQHLRCLFLQKQMICDVL